MRSMIRILFLFIFTYHLSAQETLQEWKEEVVTTHPDVILYLRADNGKPLNGTFKLIPDKNKPGNYILCELKKGYLHHKVSEYRAKKLVAESEYKEGIREGVTYAYSGGKVERETPYVNGKKEGKEVVYHRNGNIREEYIYRKGIKDGPFTVYTSVTGKKLQEGYFVQGVLDGLYKELITQTGRDDERHVLYRLGEILSFHEYREDGECIKEILHPGNPLLTDEMRSSYLSQAEYDMHGVRTVERLYQGEEQLLCLYFNSMGRMTHWGYFKEGTLAAVYYPDQWGQLIEIRYYDNGVFTGSYDLYYPGGRIVKESVKGDEKIMYHPNGLPERRLIKGSDKQWKLKEKFDERGNKIEK